MLPKSLLVAVAIAGSVSSAALAQSGPSLEVEVGLAGMSAPQQPVELSATISTPVLLSGRLRVRGNQLAVSRPIEVPAGSTHTYQLTLPPLTDGTRLTVEVLDPRGDPVASSPAAIRFPGRDTMVVGVVGEPSLVAALGRVRAIITDRPVTAVAVTPDTPDSQLEVLDYLVVPRAGAAGLERSLSWVEAGGRAVVDASLLTLAAPRPTGVEGVWSDRRGAGQLIAVEALDARGPAEWSQILRPAPLVFAGSPEFAPDTRGLLQAASESGSRQVPSLPWLGAALVAFAVIVGPVNFFVLSRLGKRDWAWVTIPALAVIAVTGFWVAGRQRIGGTHLAHASVIVQSSEVKARSAVIVAAGQPGERIVRFEPTATVFPEPSLFGGSVSEVRLEDTATVRLALDQLGFAGIGVVSRPDLPLPRVSVEGGDLRVENLSTLRFWGWGVVRANSSTIGEGSLDPGQTAAVPLPRKGGEMGWMFIDNLMQRQQLWEDPARSNALWSFTGVMAAEAERGATYFVGLTDDYRPQVEVSGGAAPPAGITLVMIRVPSADVATDRAGAQVVGVGFINWMDWGFEGVISTPEMTVRFDLPEGVASARFVDDGRFGIPPSSYEAWDWGEGVFVEIGNGDLLGPAHISADGQVYVRVRSDNEFGDHAMSPASLSLEWGR